MVSEKWLASCHRRTVNTMRRKVAEMNRQWDDHDHLAITNELLWLIDYLDNFEDLLYFISKRDQITKD